MACFHPEVVAPFAIAVAVDGTLSFLRTLGGAVVLDSADRQPQCFHRRRIRGRLTTFTGRLAQFGVEGVEKRWWCRAPDEKPAGTVETARTVPTPHARPSPITGTLTPGQRRRTRQLRLRWCARLRWCRPEVVRARQAIHLATE